jgi:predicted transposase YbfD/YdcC
MDSTSEAVALSSVTNPSGPLVSAWQAAFAAVPDPRRRQGRRFALPALLTVAVGAMLASHTSVQAIAEWAAAQSVEVLQSVGLRQGIAPHQTTWQRLWRRLDPEAVGQALSAVLASVAVPTQRGEQGVAVDGKAQRGRRTGQPGETVHAVSAFAHDHGVVLAQVPIAAATTATKAEAELTVAPALIAQLDWHGRVFTGDALFCQRALCEHVLDAGGDYLLLVKANQPRLLGDLQLLFDPPADLRPSPPPLTDRREAVSHDHGHGRTEHRRLIASVDLLGYLDWPGHAQVFRLERHWTARGRPHQSVRYGITSLPPAVASAQRLLALRRGHWQIENGLHYVKDVTLGEDRSRLRADAAPDVFALLRSLVVSLIRLDGSRTIAARLRHFSRSPADGFRLLGVTLSQNA